MSNDILIENIGELVSLAPLAKAQRFTNITDADLGRIKDGWLAIRSGKVAGFGTGAADSQFSSLRRLDARQGLVLPGFVDAHTHPIFAGSRAHEFARRLAGATYQEIAAAGGGIKYTVAQTREAADDELAALTKRRLKRFLSCGVTTLEAKTGYGLSVEQELRLLRILAKVRGQVPQHLYITCLALHAIPVVAASASAFAHEITAKLLPALATEKLADATDAFVEKGYFSATDCDAYFKATRELGMHVRVHVDEFGDTNGAAAAARWGAVSADHLEYSSDDGIKAMASAGTVAVLLPGTSLYCGLPYTQARKFVAQKCAVALATDFNPGSCTFDNINLIASIGAIHCKLSLAEALAAVTFVAARSLRLEKSKGALQIGYDADFSLFDLPNAEEWIAAAGKSLPSSVFIAGARV